MRQSDFAPTEPMIRPASPHAAGLKAQVDLLRLCADLGEKPEPSELDFAYWSAYRRTMAWLDLPEEDRRRALARRLLARARHGEPVRPAEISDALRATGDIPGVSAAELAAHNTLHCRDAGAI